MYYNNNVLNSTRYKQIKESKKQKGETIPMNKKKKVKLYSNKNSPETTAFIVDESDKYGTVLLEYRTCKNAGKTINITTSTLKRWWKSAGEIEIDDGEQTEHEEEEVKEEPAKETEKLVTKVTPKKTPKMTKAVKINKQEKIDYLNILCKRLGFVSIPKRTHPDVIRLHKVMKLEDGSTKENSFGEIKVNHTSFVLYTRRVIILDQDKFSFIVDTDPYNRAKIKFNIDDNVLEYVMEQLAESEARNNGKN